MAKATGTMFYLLMYRHYSGKNDWWGLFDTPELAAEDGPACYESQTCEDITLEHKKEITESLLNRRVYLDKSDTLNLWIDQIELYAQKTKGGKEND